MAEDWSYNKYYYEKNKERLKKKVECGCGSKVAHYNLQHHRNTKKHKQWEADEKRKEVETLKSQVAQLQKQLSEKLPLQ